MQLCARTRCMLFDPVYPRIRVTRRIYRLCKHLVNLLAGPGYSFSNEGIPSLWLLFFLASSRGRGHVKIFLDYNFSMRTGIYAWCNNNAPAACDACAPLSSVLFFHHRNDEHVAGLIFSDLVGWISLGIQHGLASHQAVSIIQMYARLPFVRVPKLQKRKIFVMKAGARLNHSHSRGEKIVKRESMMKKIWKNIGFLIRIALECFPDTQFVNTTRDLSLVVLQHGFESVSDLII